LCRKLPNQQQYELISERDEFHEEFHEECYLLPPL
jgi:hypothetical protein